MSVRDSSQASEPPTSMESTMAPKATVRVLTQRPPEQAVRDPRGEGALEVVPGEAADVGLDAALVAELHLDGVEQHGDDRHDDQVGEERRHQDADQRRRLARGDAEPVAQAPGEARARGRTAPAPHRPRWRRHSPDAAPEETLAAHDIRSDHQRSRSLRGRPGGPSPAATGRCPRLHTSAARLSTLLHRCAIDATGGDQGNTYSVRRPKTVA